MPHHLTTANDRPDLANEVLRETWRKQTYLADTSGRSMLETRRAVATAKRFVADEAMSSFMAELATIPFRVAVERRPDTLDSLRHSARLPFPKMFLQFDGRAFRRALLQVAANDKDVWQNTLVPADSDELVAEVSWLIEQDDRDPDLIWISEFFMLNDKPNTLPFRFAYRTDDRGFDPRLKIDTLAGIFAHGIVGFNCPNIGVQYSPTALMMPKGKHWVGVESDGTIENFSVHRLVPEFGGVVRYALALLATLNDIPKIETQVRPAKSFLGGGQIRKYLDHTTLRLSLPVRGSTKTLAARLIAKARKGWHEVRPHWRIYHHGEHFCPKRADHIWLEADATGHANCRHCDARRVWIVLPHGRGDPTISVRTHKYALTHQEIT